MNSNNITHTNEILERINQLHNTIKELRLVSNRLAHALALHTDGDNTPLWVDETYRAWEKLYREHYFQEVN